MKNLLLIISLFLFTASKGCNKTLLEKIEKGKILTIEVKPIGDAYSNPAEEHTLKIFKFDTKFNITLNQNNIIFKKRISKERLIKILNFIKSWENNKLKFFSGALSYDFVKIKIGTEKKKFRAEIHSDKYLTNYIKNDTINKIKTDNFNISDEIIKKNIKREFEKIDFLDGICFSNNAKSELLIIEFGTDYFRNKIVLVNKNNLPNKLLKLIPLYSKKENTSIPSNEKDKKLFLDSFIPENILNIDYFESTKKIKLGINKDYAIKIYGNPDIIEQENEYKILKWVFIGDIVAKINKTIPRIDKPLALNSFGYKVTMFFKNDKLIGMVLINEMP